MTVRSVESRSVSLRWLTPEDEPHIRELLEGLSEEDRYMRFMRAMPHIPDSVIAALSAVNGSDHVAVAAFDGTRCVTAARYLRLRTTPTTAELAVTVAAGYRRRGLARDLILWLARDAAEKGIEHFEVYVHPANEAAVGLADRLVVWLEHDEDQMHGQVGVARLIQTLEGPVPTGRRHMRPLARTARRRRRIRALAGSDASLAGRGHELRSIVETLR